MRNRRQVRRVGLDQHPVERDDLGRVADVLRFGKRDVSGERNQKSQVEAAARVFDGAREAVQNSTESGGCPMFGDQLQAVVPGVLAVVGRAGSE